MPQLEINTSSKAVKDYYVDPGHFEQLGVKHGTAVICAFLRLQDQCGRKERLTIHRRVQLTWRHSPPFRYDSNYERLQ